MRRAGRLWSALHGMVELFGSVESGSCLHVSAWKDGQLIGDLRPKWNKQFFSEKLLDIPEVSTIEKSGCECPGS